MNERVGILLVCHANICRSPLAEAIFREVAAASGLTDRFSFDSAGTYAIEGAAPHRHSIEVGQRHGVEVTGAGRQILRRDLEDFDHVLVMDAANLVELTALAAPAAFGPLDAYHAQIALVRIAAGTADSARADVDDPIGKPIEAYERVYELLRAAAEALLPRLASK